MNNMKRLMALVLVLTAVLAFAACTPEAPSTEGTTTAPTSTAPTTTAPTTQPEKQVTFRVKVVDEAGNPVAGVGVQICKESCVIGETNEEGWAEFTNAVEDGYHANIMYEPAGFEIPEGKELDKSEVDFPAGQTELTLTLKVVDKAAE